MDLVVVSLPAEAASLPAEIAALEARLFEPAGEAGKGTADEPPELSGRRIQLLEARSQPEEIREALRWLKARVVRDGLSLSDCALILPEENSYRPPLLAAAAEFGLPLRLAHGGRLLDTPPVAALADLLALPLRNWPAGSLLDTLRAPFFNLSGFGLQRGDARELDLVCRQGQIVEGLEAWREVLAGLEEEEDLTTKNTKYTKGEEKEKRRERERGSGFGWAGG